MDIRSLYQKGVEKFEVGKSAQKILSQVISGDESIKDVVNVISEDAFFTEQFILEGSSLLKTGPVKSLSQAISLIGLQNSIYFLLGHSIVRIFNPKADIEFKNISTSAAKIHRARESEGLAKAAGCPYSGSAFATGYVYDIFEEWLNSNPTLKASFSDLFAKTWLHGLRTATLAWSFTNFKKMDLPLKKLLFGSGLIHDIGKLLLAFSFPDTYKDLQVKHSYLKMRNPYDDAFEVELEQQAFNYSHPEAGSLLLWQLEVIKDLEASVEYHHDFGFLSIRDPRLNQIEVCLRIADRLACLLETTEQLPEAVAQEIIEPFASHFPISAREVKDLVLTLREKRILL